MKIEREIKLQFLNSPWKCDLKAIFNSNIRGTQHLSNLMETNHRQFLPTLKKSPIFSLVEELSETSPIPFKMGMQMFTQ